MANLGNAWHIPAGPEPRGLTGMRHPVGAIVSGTRVTICSGNQYQGDGGNPGNQLQVGSTVMFKRATDANWLQQPMEFRNAVANNKYFTAKIAAGTFQTGDVVQYYLRIPYDDHDTTFVHRNGDGSATTASEATAQATPFTFAIEDAAIKGQWGPLILLPNVAIHTHVLPNGRVLMWGRRDQPEDPLDVQMCTPFVWNPKHGAVTMTLPPERADGSRVNLFCSGHAFLPHGRLLVVGGHLKDGDGISYAGLYDAATNTWTPTAPMTTPSGEEVRRWYPTATTLPNGTVLVASGSYVDPAQPPDKQTIVVDLLQLWDNGVWKTIPKADGTPLNFLGMPLYPRLHVAADGRVFMSGPNDRTLLLKTTPPGEWTQVGFRTLGIRDYCPAVMYGVDKIAYIGGGNEVGTHVPTADVEVIDLAGQPPQWLPTGSLNHPRRQHNATVLPDGTVLVTGGTRGGGGPNQGFNDLDAGQPVHQAELWDPATGQWAELAAEEIDRCYHATAVLLPDARVLSAGGGEYRPDNVNANLPEDSHRDAQVFSPPYLFKGPQPQITSAPASVSHGETIEVATPQGAQIAKVSLVSLGSVTHSFDEHQRILFLTPTMSATGVSVTMPASVNECPPGHYMLFLLTAQGVPSIASIVRVQPTAEITPLVGDVEIATTTAGIREAAAAPFAGWQPVGATDTSAGLAARGIVDGRRRTYLQVYSREAEVAATAKGTAITVGITGTCPYGIGACWGGAYEALKRLDEVELVAPIPNPEDSTAEVYLRRTGLPPLDTWDEQFSRIVNGTYELRGVELTLRGSIDARGDELFLVGAGQRSAVRLVSLAPEDKIQWNHAARMRKPLESDEAGAHTRLLDAHHRGLRNRAITITGPLTRSGGGQTYDLHVRIFAD